MPELTVSILAHNSERHIKDAIASVLGQEGVELELIVIDDGSSDDTSGIVKSFLDPRITLIRNERKMGAAHCHDLVVELSQSPFIAQVGSKDLVLPGAFQALVGVGRKSARVGLVHCYSFEIDENGNTTRDSFHVRRAFLLSTRRPGIDYKRELLISGNVIDHFRIYSREALQVVGQFKRTIKYQTDYDMALRIADSFEIGLVRAFLYCRRIHHKSVRESPGEALVDRSRRFFYLRQLMKRNEIQFLKDKNYNLNRLFIRGLYDSLALRRLRLAAARAKGLHKNLPGMFFWKICIPIVNVVYHSIIIHLHWWPIGPFLSKRDNQVIKGKKVAYYIWHFPILSQTFIHRELAALKRSGVSVEVFADEPEDVEIADENAKSLLKNTHYLYPIDQGRMRKYKRHFFWKHPFGFLNLFFFVMTRRYGEYKSVTDDIHLFLKATYLAGVLKDREIDHVHTPWADETSFVALLASKLLGLSYSVQARAHDIHRNSYLYALPEKFQNAAFVITNTRYNQIRIRSVLKKCHWVKIVIINNGIDLDKFTPNYQEGNQCAPVRILCVARLIEQKGLDYLLKAFKILKDNGFQLQCEIIGGPEEPLYTNYFIQLKKLHRRLGLEDCVLFLGAQPFAHVLEKYKAADIFVLPGVIAEDGSRDITPNSLLEAMAMRLPVVSTAITGIPEIVEDGISGLLVPPRDTDALVAAVIRLIQDPALRKNLGAEARRRVQEKFDIDRNIKKYIDLFARVTS